MASLRARPIDLRRIQCIVLSIFWIGSSCIAEFNPSSDLGSNDTQREFDFFMLSLLWPGTACLSSAPCCPSNACCRRSNALTEFTIHGLWPDYDDGSWPACCPGRRFDIKEISTLLSIMNKYWPSFSCESASNCHGGTGLFWEHEKNMDLVCFQSYEMNMTNVTEVLREAGYVASNSEKYPLRGIVSAIKNAFSATPQLASSSDAVEELRLCFYKDFKIRDCAVESNTKSGLISSEESCPKYVSLSESNLLDLENKDSGASESTFKSDM